MCALFLQNEGEKFYSNINIIKNPEKKIIDYNVNSSHIPTFDIPTSTTTFVSPPIQPEIQQPRIKGQRDK